MWISISLKLITQKASLIDIFSHHNQQELLLFLVFLFFKKGYI